MDSIKFGVFVVVVGPGKPDTSPPSIQPVNLYICLKGSEGELPCLYLIINSSPILSSFAARHSCPHILFPNSTSSNSSAFEVRIVGFW